MNRLQQLSYMHLLKRYLESVCSSDCEAHDSYAKLVQKLDQLHSFNQDIIQLLLDANPIMIEPLLKEMFDLNC